MELKWLEDLVAVAETGHFARAAERRNITQSAFSRRIKSLELWIGAELLDRSQHPVRLTASGRDFLPVAKDMVRQSYNARGRAMEATRIADTAITVACLHTLSLYWLPSLVARLRQTLGPFETSIVAETRTVEEYLELLVNGSTDFFICYRHDSVPLDVDQGQFPSLKLGRDRLLPYAQKNHGWDDLESDIGAAVPHIDYSGSSFLSTVVGIASKRAPFRSRLKTVYRGSLAESLMTAAIWGLGIAWLPESVVMGSGQSEHLTCLSEDWAVEMDLVVFKAASNSNQTVRVIWDLLQSQTGGEPA